MGEVDKRECGGYAMTPLRIFSYKKLIKHFIVILCLYFSSFFCFFYENRIGSVKCTLGGYLHHQNIVFILSCCFCLYYVSCFYNK